MNSDHCISDLPEGWSVDGKNIMKGGQATAVHVRHIDGREGVYRELRRPISEVSKQRFYRELKILSEKVQHRAVVTLYEWSASVDRPWYISELGNSFEHWWKGQRKELDQDPEKLVNAAISILTELSSALVICHGLGIIHRDIKPKNIIMKRDVSKTWPMLIDFGIAHDEEGNRLTATDQAVGNAKFSPDIMRTRLETVTPWLDVFDLAQLLIWMLDIKSAKNHWQRPVHWKYALYDERLFEETQLAIRAFTAACSTQVTAPFDGRHLISLLENLFPQQPQNQEGQLDPRAIITAKRRGESTKQLAMASIAEEVAAAAPIAERVYRELRQTLIDVVGELSAYETSMKVLVDNQFHYQIVGATDLYWVSLGPPACNIQLRIKGKVVTWSEPVLANKLNRDYWQRAMPRDTICFTFALEGGVVQSGDSRYLVGRWVTIRRDGSLYLHPLSAGFGHYSNNDLGGSPEGHGTITSMGEVRDFAISVLTDQNYWEYIATVDVRV